MPEENTSTAAVPPLEGSSIFQDRIANALGGPPSSPDSFQRISRPSLSRPGGAAAQVAASPPRPHDPAFDGPSPELLKSRALVGSLVKPLATLRGALESSLESAQSIVDAIKSDPLAKAEADLQGINLNAVAKFLNQLAKSQD